MIGKIIVLCIIGFFVFLAGLIVGMVIEEWSQEQKEKLEELRQPRGWDKRQ